MTATQVDAELLPCPFCGGEDGDLINVFDGDRLEGVFFVACIGCGAEGGGSNEDHAAASANWNRRALASPTAGAASDGERAFLAAIIERSPNGEPVTVQYHPNGDWSVFNEAPASSSGVAGLAATWAEHEKIAASYDAFADAATSDEAKEHYRDLARQVRAATFGRPSQPAPATDGAPQGGGHG